MKPRIKRYAGSRWECRDDDWIGFGGTPQAAYQSWSVGASMYGRDALKTRIILKENQTEANRVREGQA